MKRKIALLLLLTFSVLFLFGCRQRDVTEQNKKTESPKGWVDDTEALSVKLIGQTKYLVHNFLGEPVAHLLYVKSDVYLDSDGVGVFVYYNDNERVTHISGELPYSTVSSNVSAQKRCEIMEKIIGKSKQELIDRYGKPNNSFEKESKWEYNNFYEHQVNIYFDENQIAQKLLIQNEK